MYYVYVIRSAGGRLYTGHTGDLFRRLCQHNLGLCKTTKSDKGWKLVYYDCRESRGKAIKHERWLKTGIGRTFLKKYLIGLDDTNSI